MLLSASHERTNGSWRESSRPRKKSETTVITLIALMSVYIYLQSETVPLGPHGAISRCFHVVVMKIKRRVISH